MDLLTERLVAAADLLLVRLNTVQGSGGCRIFSKVVLVALNGCISPPARRTFGDKNGVIVVVVDCRMPSATTFFLGPLLFLTTSFFTGPLFYLPTVFFLPTFSFFLQPFLILRIVFVVVVIIIRHLMVRSGIFLVRLIRLASSRPRVLYDDSGMGGVVGGLCNALWRLGAADRH